MDVIAPRNPDESPGTPRPSPRPISNLLPRPGPEAAIRKVVLAFQQPGNRRKISHPRHCRDSGAWAGAPEVERPELEQSIAAAETLEVTAAGGAAYNGACR